MTIYSYSLISISSMMCVRKIYSPKKTHFFRWGFVLRSGVFFFRRPPRSFTLLTYPTQKHPKLCDAFHAKKKLNFLYFFLVLLKIIEILF